MSIGALKAFVAGFVFGGVLASFLSNTPPTLVTLGASVVTLVLTTPWFEK